MKLPAAELGELDPERLKIWFDYQNFKSRRRVAMKKKFQCSTPFLTKYTKILFNA